MINLRVALATTAMLHCVTICVTIGTAEASVIEVQYRTPVEQSTPVEPKAPSSERESRTKERTPPPRPIVPPEGQQQNPALREDCAWLGQRIVSLLVRDDPMTGNDFVPFYQRFGCPQEHLSKAFGCVVGFGSAENEALADRVAQCWTDPAVRPVAPVESAKKPAEPADGSKKPTETPKRPAEPADMPKKPSDPGDSLKEPKEPPDTLKKPAELVPPVTKPANGSK